MKVPKRKRSVIAFTDALCRLVCDTPLKKITVTRICDEAGYTSMAFYSSFENKYDFLHSVIDYEAQVFAACVYNKLEQIVSGSEEKRRAEWHSLYLLDYFKYVADNKLLYHCILNDLIVPDGIVLFSKRIAHYMRQFLSIRPTDERPELFDFTEVIFEITEAQMLMVIRYWLGKMPDLEPQTVAELYCDQFLFRRMLSLERDPETGGFRAGM